MKTRIFRQPVQFAFSSSPARLHRAGLPRLAFAGVGTFRAWASRLERSAVQAFAVMTVCVTSALTARVQGAVDPAFDPNANGFVTATVVQPDGKIVVGGQFSMVGGTARNRIARLGPNGAVDPSFDPNAQSSVYTMAVQPDGKIVIGGFFVSVGVVSRNHVARLNPDGTLDPGFNPNTDSFVFSTTLQPDGKAVIGGTFHTVGSTARNRVARLNADGTPDPAFDPNANNAVWTSALQANGQIILGGAFTVLGGVARNRIARLNADGTLDPGFSPVVGSDVLCTAEQPDGKIIIGGAFTSVNGAVRNRIARLNADGTLDAGFDPNANSSVINMTLQADGRIIVAGNFTTVGGVVRNRIARLNADGSLDGSFDPNANDQAWSTALHTDGTIVIGGVFTTVSGVARNYLARLLNEPATQVLRVTSPARIEWLRGGGAPETARVTFERSTDGVTWTQLGAGTRIAGGWEMTGLSLPASGTIRARAFPTSGNYNGSSGLVESLQSYVLNRPPEAYPAPASQVVELGVDFIVTTAELADVDGDLLAYLWLRGATVLAAGTVTPPAGGARVPIGGLNLPSNGTHFGLGIHSIELRVTDGVNASVSAFVSVEVRDTIAPTLSLPPNQVANATAPTGATVNYPPATVTDAGGPVTITYSKAAGTTFPIGTTRVTVTATDRAGNRSTGSFKVTVKGALDQIEDLIDYVTGLRISLVTKVSLTVRLSVAKVALLLHQQQVANYALREFIDEVREQRARLTTAQAEHMITDATRILSVIGP